MKYRSYLPTILLFEDKYFIFNVSLTTEMPNEQQQLEAKLQEIGTLLGGLGEAPKTVNRSLKQGKLARASLGTSPEAKNWKNMCTLSEAMAAQEGRLPPILENKQYPRKTLEQQELKELISNSETTPENTESPDIGPPPISQFVDEDPVKIDLPRRQQPVSLENEDDAGPAFSFNLEQRRKRRESGGISEQSEEDNHKASTEPAPEVKESLKAGAKRKLSVREDDDNINVTACVGSSSDGFKFSRAVSDQKINDTNASQSAVTKSKTIRELAVARGVSREKRSTTPVNSTRKVLGPKSVNNSPKKATRGPVKDEIKSAKANVQIPTIGKDNSREATQRAIVVEPKPERITDPIEVHLEPETPAAVDIFSPSSSQPSTARDAESRDTPPPPELKSGTEGIRPSRRARGAISYAEPSLRDKMRRPTKAFADAVDKDGKIVHAPTIKHEDGHGVSFTIKTEAEDEDAWKTARIYFTTTPIERGENFI
ncbi:putative Shugoshin [Glarea lozoyensis 74030]|uniref:Putative Shugoshin n=1 Tax=Glarea lozoyensis (strain ATCC 74030 / MF5533) TaxID=1104152 RepID=H0ED79_GLAL7|nr:putative Shugoshin [Glarea lozoyensis 74030]